LHSYVGRGIASEPQYAEGKGERRKQKPLSERKQEKSKELLHNWMDSVGENQSHDVTRKGADFRLVINTKESVKKNLSKEEHVMKTVISTKINKSAVSPHTTQWEIINWVKINKYVKKLRQRIFRAEQLGQCRKVRKLQRLMIRSRANLLLSIRRVTQMNKGKRTAGVDGHKVLSSEERIKLFNLLKTHNINRTKPKPAKRTYIPKKNGKLRPLGIPIIKDRIYQNITKNALEPQWEAKFEATSYGFRAKRSTHDAIANLFTKLSSKSNKTWIFEGDFKGCFDNINHDFIMNCIQSFPGKKAIHGWIKAGYVDNNVFYETPTGTPQGGIISPLLANIALHGMEDELGIEYLFNKRDGYILKKDSPAVVRYADDFVILCKTKDVAESIYCKIKPYLEKRGLTLAQDKTKVTHISEGFDFLGFNLKQYYTMDGSKLLIKPSKVSVKKARQAIREEFEQSRGRPVKEVIFKLNPIIKGTGYYWSSVVAKKIYEKIDHYTWLKTMKHLRSLHPKKSWKWRIKQYFKSDHTGVSKNKWILTDPHNPKNQLTQIAWIPIERHVMVKYKNSPDDPTLKEYFNKRDEKQFNRNNILSRQRIAKTSGYKCRVCKQSLVGEESLEINHIVPKALDGKDEYSNLELLHTSCHVIHHQTMEKFGGGKSLKKFKDYFKSINVIPSSKEGLKIMRQIFKHAQYNCLR
jgi:RNA-directed DNA polymerase